MDDLRARLDSATPEVRSLKAADLGEEAEWQGLGAPVSSGEIGKVVDINPQETQDRDLSLRKSNLEIITKALEKHHGNRKLAAKEVGISERTLYRWIEKYHLD